MKKELNKWQFRYCLGREHTMNDKFIKKLVIGFFKINMFPTQGEELQRKHYKGAIVSIRFWWPISSINIKGMKKLFWKIYRYFWSKITGIEVATNTTGVVEFTITD